MSEGTSRDQPRESPEGRRTSDQQLDALWQALAKSDAAATADTPEFLDWLGAMLDKDVRDSDAADLQLIADALRARLHASAPMKDSSSGEPRL